jgi:hypothetical protein
MDKMINLLEKMANNAHHKIDVESLIKDLQPSIGEAFRENNFTHLRQLLLQPEEIVAHRKTIIKVRK